MIKLNRGDAPKQLTDDKIKELTQIYLKDNSKHVWRQPYIKESLAHMSNGKCAYCECALGEESKYLEIEHFLPKGKHPDKVVIWDNLLPSCKRCNLPSAKGTHDPSHEPIINPTTIDPKDHLYMEDYRIKGKDELGSTTVKILYLNDTEKLTKKRFKIGNKLIDELENLHENVMKFRDLINNDGEFTRKIIRRLKCLLSQGLPTEEYAATCSTVLLNDKCFIEIENLFKYYNIWHEELEELTSLCNQIKLEKR